MMMIQELMYKSSLAFKPISVVFSMPISVVPRLEIRKYIY